MPPLGGGSAFSLSKELNLSRKSLESRRLSSENKQEKQLPLHLSGVIVFVCRSSRCAVRPTIKRSGDSGQQNCLHFGYQTLKLTTTWCTEKVSDLMGTLWLKEMVVSAEKRNEPASYWCFASVQLQQQGPLAASPPRPSKSNAQIKYQLQQESRFRSAQGRVEREGTSFRWQTPQLSPPSILWTVLRALHFLQPLATCAASHGFGLSCWLRDHGNERGQG